MKFTRILSAFYGLTAVAAAGLAIYLCLTAGERGPVLLTPADDARQQVCAVMDAVAAGDFQGAAELLDSEGDLGLDRAPADPLGTFLWDAYADSFSYELLGECYPTADGLAQNVRLTCLDLPGVTEHLRDYAQQMLAQRIAETEDPSEIYDENNQYRESFVMEVLYDAAALALEENGRDKSAEITLNLVWQDGCWQVRADDRLLDVLSGDVLY